MSERINSLFSRLIEEKEAIAIGSGGDVYTSYFSPDISFSVQETPVMELVAKIQSTKKAQAQVENWESSEIIHRLEKLKLVINDNRKLITRIEAHFQGTTAAFQEAWSINPVLSLLDRFLENSDKMGHCAPKGLIGAITPRAQSFLEIGTRIIFAFFHRDGLLLKPARASSLSALIWSELLTECEFPEGLITFAYGSGGVVGKFIMDHPGVRHISFSGNYETLKNYPLSLEKKYQLYFNGKNSVCLLPDYDYKKNMNKIVRTFIEHNGKSCFSPSRLFIIDSYENDFKIELANYLNSISELKSIDDEGGFLPLQKDESARLKELAPLFRSEEAKSIFQNDRFKFFSDLPNCSELFQENLELPIFSLTAVKYTHEMSKWVNNSSFGHSMIIFGPEGKAKKLVMKSEVGGIIFNPEPLEFRQIDPVKMSGFGETNFSIPNRFYSYIKY